MVWWIMWDKQHYTVLVLPLRAMVSVCEGGMGYVIVAILKGYDDLYRYN